MAVRDLWTLRDGSPSKRHGRGLRWRVDVPGHPVEHFAHRGVAERREKTLWAAPKAAARGETVGDMIAVWAAGKAGLSKRGWESAAYGAQVALAEWETVRLRDVAEDDVRSWIAGMVTDQGGPASLSMRTKALQCVKGALAVAVRRGLLADNPAAEVTVPQQRVREGRALTLAEAHTLVAAMDARYRALVPGEGVTPFGAMLWLMLTAGPRIGEVCALDVGSVDVHRRRLRALGKGGRWRNLPVSLQVLAMLPLEGRAPGEPLFTTVRSPGGRLSPTPWRRRWFAPAVADAGLGDVRPHDLRHTAVTWAIHAGASIHDVQQMCGHARPSITWDIYGHLMDGHLDDVADRVGGLLAVPGTVAGQTP